MPKPYPAGLRLGIVEPRDAIAAFQRRRLLQPSFRWQDVWQEEHGRALAVAGVQRLDVLQVFQDELSLALAEGRSLADFRKAIRPRLAAKGYWGDVEVSDAETGEKRVTRFNDNRLRTIFDVNMRQSQAVGRWERIQRSKGRLPYLVYFTMQDERVRASHRRWNALVLPVDHPFWDTHYPPNGWRCRCYAYAIDDVGVERLKRAGVKIQTTAPDVDWVTYVNPRTGEVAPVPRGIDPGFAYNPGKQRDAQLYEQALRKAAAASPVSAAVAVAEATFQHPAMLVQSTAAFGAFVDQVLALRRAAGRVQYVGSLAPGVVRALEQRGIEQRAAVLAVRDLDVLHALRPGKPDDVRLSPGVYRRLPELLRRASALLLEKGEPPVLLYVVDLVQADGTVAKLVLQLDERVKLRVDGKPARVPLNIVRTATVVDPAALRDRTRYELVWGRLE